MKYLKTKEIVYVDEKYGCVKTMDGSFFYFEKDDFIENIAFQGFDHWGWFVIRENVIKNRKYKSKYFVSGIDKSNFSNINYDTKFNFGNDGGYYSSGGHQKSGKYVDGENEVATYFHENGTMDDNYSYFLGEDELVD